MQNKKYKLIQCYPGSPKLGTILDKYDKVYKSHPNCTPYLPSEIENNPKFWEEIIEYTPYVVHGFDQWIRGVTRVVDGVYFSKGMYIKMPGSEQLGFIYDFEVIDGKLVINHTFSYLMNKAGIKDHLKWLRPCLYTKEEMVK